MKLPIKVDQIIQMQVPVGKLLFTCEAKILANVGSSLKTTLPLRVENGAKISIKAEQVTVYVPVPDAVYSMSCPVEEVGTEVLTLGIPSDKDIQRIQRRDHVRVPTTLPCWVELPRRGAYGEPQESQVLNLSGGGCALVNADKLISGTQARLTICLPDDESIIALVKVKYERSFVVDKEMRYLAGLEFQDMDELQRGQIIRYVFDVQRGLRQATTILRPLGGAEPVVRAPETKPLKWSALQKRDVVLRMIRGETSAALAEQLGVAIPVIEKWRDRALAAMEAVLVE